MKKFFATLLAAIIILPAATTNTYAEQEPATWENSELLKPDVNQDGAINAIDASIVLSEYAAKSIGQESTLTQTEQFLADCDLNSNINAADATGILEIYAYNSTHEDKMPRMGIRFFVSIDLGGLNNIDIYAYSFEECEAIVEKDKAERDFHEGAKYTIYRCENTYKFRENGSSYTEGKTILYRR